VLVLVLALVLVFVLDSCSCSCSLVLLLALVLERDRVPARASPSMSTVRARARAAPVLVPIVPGPPAWYVGGPDVDRSRERTRMRRAIPSLFSGLLLCLAAAPVFAAAVHVRVPATALVAVDADRCSAPDRAAFAAAVDVTSAPAWTLAGAPETRWDVRVDAERAAALGVPTPSLRAHFATAAAQPGDATALLAGALPPAKKSKDGLDVPLQAFAAVEKDSVRPLHVTLDGRPVLVAGTGDAAGPFAVVAAAAALASACGVPLDAVEVAVLAPEVTRWTVAYRTTVDVEAARLARVQVLEGTIAAAREGGRTLGLHRAEGGAVWGFARGTTEPALPMAKALETPGFHAIVVRAEKGVWLRPLQSVVRFAAPAARAAEVFAAAQHIAGLGGPKVNVLLTVPQVPREFVGADGGAALGRAKLAPEDVALALDGLELRTARGEVVRVRLTASGEPATLPLVGPGGKVHPLGTLGTLRERPARTATVLDGEAVVYLGLPTEATVPVARAMSENPLPDPVRATVHHWNVLREDDAQRLLSWWRGELAD
jgi:hypothetical protein